MPQNRSIEEIHRLQVIRHKCETDLLFFCRYFMKELAGTRFVSNWHHKEITQALSEIEGGGNLLINMPPRYSKTEIAVIGWICQSIARNPRAKFIHLSYSSELALENSTRCREIIKHPKFQELWPIQIKLDADSKAKWYTVEGGGVYATQAGGAVTGFGAGTPDSNGDLFGGAIIIDDPHKVDNSDSESEREKVNRRLNTTIASRRNSRKTPILVIMQRLHESDMSGYIIEGKSEMDFEHLKIAALDENDEALWPWKHTTEELRRMRDSDNSVVRKTFWTQYMQEPAPEDGEVFKAEWFKNRYQLIIPRETTEQLIHSWDTATKTGEHNDPSACTVWRIFRGNAYLEEVINKRLEYPDLKRKLVEMAERDNPNAILVEDKQTGMALIQDVKAMGRWNIIPIGTKQVSERKQDKETRARRVTLHFEAGRIIIPENAHWLHEFEKQMLLFPNGKHDDIVDSVSQFINWWQGSNTTAWNEKIREIYKL